jgi:hypothetical protein
MVGKRILVPKETMGGEAEVLWPDATATGSSSRGDGGSRSRDESSALAGSEGAYEDDKILLNCLEHVSKMRRSLLGLLC